MNENRREIIYITALIFLIAMNSFWVYKNITLKSAMNNIKERFEYHTTELKDQILNFKHIKDAYHEYIINTLKYENEKLSDFRMINTESGEEQMLGDLLGDQQIIVYRIPKNSCDICYDEITKKVFTNVGSYGKNMIILILSNA